MSTCVYDTQDAKRPVPVGPDVGQETCGIVINFFPSNPKMTCERRTTLAGPLHGDASFEDLLSKELLARPPPQ